MGNTAGFSALLIREYIVKLSGKDGLKKALALLSTDDQKKIDRLGPKEWVPYEYYFRLLRAGAAATGVEESEFCRRFGEYQVEHDNHFLYSLALKVGGPRLMVIEASQIWKRYHNTGKLVIEEYFPNQTRGRLVGVEGGGPMLCEVVAGFMDAGLRLAGARVASVRHSRCIHRGDDCCEYTAEWK